MGTLEVSVKGGKVSRCYQFVRFQHLSKAAYLSIIQLAQSNGEVFCPQSANATPRSQDGKLIRLWDYRLLKDLDS